MNLSGLFAAIYLLILLISRKTFLGDPGVGWHIKTGEYIAQYGKLPYEDPFLTASFGKPWVATQWLSDVVGFSLYSFGGTPLLQFVCALFLLLVLYPLQPYLARSADAGRGIPVFLALVTTAIVFSLQAFARPVLASFLFFAICWSGVVLLRRNKSHYLYMALPLVFLLWVQSHPAFVLGFALLAFDFVWVVFQRVVWRRPQRLVLRGGVLLSAVIVIAASPYGALLVESALKLGGSSYFMSLNAEWQSPSPFQVEFFPFYFCFSLMVFLLISSKRTLITPFEWCVVIGCAAMSCLHVRYIPFYGIAMFLPLTVLYDFWFAKVQDCQKEGALKAALRRIDNRESGRFGWAEFTGGILIGGTLLLVSPARITHGDLCHWPGSRVPSAEMLQVLKTVEAERLYHSPNLGGFLIACAPRKTELFLDDRNVLHGAPAYEDYLQIAVGGIYSETLEEKYGFTHALVAHGPGEPDFLLGSNRWEEIQSDKYFKLLRRYSEEL